MVSDPYQVLGVPKGASQDEIKKAYRKKAKECHPDLHPDDPDAGRRMREVNEAYDMLMNPGKYQSRQQSSGQQTYQQGNPYGQSYGGNPYGQGYGGWSPFDDMFGYGGYSGYGAQTPPPQDAPGDSEAIRRAIYCINTRQYQAALDLLRGVPSGLRNARWFYLSALANQGLGNSMTALEHIQQAVQMEPANALYQQLLNQYRRAGQAYQQNARGFNVFAMGPHGLCLSLCLSQLLCRCFWCC